jgi:LAO/AO transport system kinase
MALAAPEGVRILDAAGFDRIVVETVGVGQAEVDVAAATDTAVVVLAPGLGDAVQMAKAGVLETADVFVVNKADREGAGEVARELGRMLHLGQARAWEPPVVMTTATTGEGIDELVAAVADHRAWAGGTGALEGKRRDRLRQEVRSLASAQVARTIELTLAADPTLLEGLDDRSVDPYAAATALVERSTP